MNSFVLGQTSSRLAAQFSNRVLDLFSISQIYRAKLSAFYTKFNCQILLRKIVEDERGERSWKTDRSCQRNSTASCTNRKSPTLHLLPVVRMSALKREAVRGSGRREREREREKRVNSRMADSFSFGPRNFSDTSLTVSTSG